MGNTRSVSVKPVASSHINRKNSQNNAIRGTEIPKPVKKEETNPSELSERDIAFLCSQTGLTAEEVINYHKQFFQDNPNGRLDRERFRKFYCLLQKESPDRLGDMCDHIFRAFDADGNGFVEFGEFLVAFAFCSRGDLRTRLEYAFSCYDLDSNGYLTEDEIKLVVRAMYNLLGIQHVNDYPPDELAKDLLKKLDTSNTGRIARDEFIHGLMKDGIYRNMINPFN